MPDREKVCNDLRNARTLINDGYNERGTTLTGDRCKYCVNAIDAAIIKLKELEAVVRCKDCKYGEPWGVLIGCGTAKGFGITHNPDWFCADGEGR